MAASKPRLSQRRQEETKGMRVVKALKTTTMTSRIENDISCRQRSEKWNNLRNGFEYLNGCELNVSIALVDDDHAI
jgi:hypothetical protein